MQSLRVFAGFIKFLECYYMLLVTKRRQVGTLCGHTIYTVGESRLIAVPHRSVQTDVANSNDEARFMSFLSLNWSFCDDLLGFRRY